MALGLYQMLSREYLNSWFARFAAAAVIIALPIAILTMVMQRFYQEAMSGGVKGRAGNPDTDPPGGRRRGTLRPRLRPLGRSEATPAVASDMYHRCHARSSDDATP